MKLQEALKTDRFKDELHKASLNVIYTAYWMKSKMSAVFKEHGLTEEQFNVMRILKGKHPEAMCVRDIASRMLEKNSNVPRIIDRLVAKKLVKRATSKEDRRETLIVLTEKGISHLAVASSAVENLSEEILNLTQSEATQLHELLEKFRKID
ncbi:MAG TPA: MarR family transcriptional regulator [Flavipsychrobacter sp.]|nr:MarR family transcriptional regulator [Flavipsychrobacter sp.]